VRAVSISLALLMAARALHRDNNRLIDRIDAVNRHPLNRVVRPVVHPIAAVAARHAGLAIDPAEIQLVVWPADPDPADHLQTRGARGEVGERCPLAACPEPRCDEVRDLSDRRSARRGERRDQRVPALVPIRPTTRLVTLEVPVLAPIKWGALSDRHSSLSPHGSLG
jgi:hypothetical protein